MEKVWASLSDVSKKTYSPFVFYFIAAWILHNHMIIGALLDDNLDPLVKSGYIQARSSSFWDMFFTPAWHALFIFSCWLGLHFISAISWDLSVFVTEIVKKRLKKNSPSITEGELEAIKSDYEATIKNLSNESNQLSVQNRSAIKEKENQESEMINERLEHEKNIIRINERHSNEIVKLNDEGNNYIQSIERKNEQQISDIVNIHEKNYRDLEEKRRMDILSVISMIIMDKDLKKLTEIDHHAFFNKVIVFDKNDIDKIGFDINKNKTVGVSIIEILEMVIFFSESPSSGHVRHKGSIDGTSPVQDILLKGIHPLSVIRKRRDA